MVKRHPANLIKAHLKNYTAVALLGARQSGKTTLAKTFSALYFDLEMNLTTSTGKRDLDRLRKTAAMIGADRIVLVSRSNRTIRGQDTITTAVRGLLGLIPEIQ